MSTKLTVLLTVVFSINFASAQWIAYNDHYQGTNSSNYCTFWNVFGTTGGAPGNNGLLKNIASGEDLTAKVTIINNGAIGGTSSGAPATGTPAAKAFPSNIIDFGTGTLNHAIQMAHSNSVLYVFTNLNNTRLYNFKATAIRGGAYPARWTLCELMGAGSFSNAHSSGVITSTQVPGKLIGAQVAFNSGSNNIASMGDIVDWEGIVPSNTAFTVRVTQYTNTIPAGYMGGPGVGDATKYGYAFNCFRLEEYLANQVPTNVAIVVQPQPRVVTEGQSATLSVSATGYPINFQWFKGGVPIPGATAATLSFSNPSTNATGSYYAIVSNQFNSVTSSVVTLTVYPDLSQVLVAMTKQVWRCDQSGNDLGAAWREKDYNDSAWPQGLGVFAWEDTAATLAIIGPLTNSTLSLTNLSGQRVLTHYFRTRFMLTNPEAIAFLSFTNLMDDGCVVYLNGQELYRINLTNGTINATWLAANASEGEFIATNIPARSLLVNGTNLLAVEVHQSGTNSSDVVMGLSMMAHPWNSGPVTIVQPPQNQFAAVGNEAAFSVLASGQAPLHFQWQFNGLDIPGATNSNFMLGPVTLAKDGFYSVRVSNSYGAQLSLPGRLLVEPFGLTPFYVNNFENGVGPEWSTNNTEATPRGARTFLGQFTNQTVSLSLSNLPVHTNLTCLCDLFVIRSWDGNIDFRAWGPDCWNLDVAGGPVLLSTTFNSTPATYAADGGETRLTGQAYPGTWPGSVYPALFGAVETNTLGFVFDERPDSSWVGVIDAVYHLAYTIPDQSRHLKLQFAATLRNPSNFTAQGLRDESWGLDNVQIFLDQATMTGRPVIGSFLVADGRFQFAVTDVPHQGQVILEASPDLKQWTGLTTNTAAGMPLYYSIPSTNQPGLFFRVMAQ